MSLRCTILRISVIISIMTPALFADPLSIDPFTWTFLGDQKDQDLTAAPQKIIAVTLDFASATGIPSIRNATVRAGTTPNYNFQQHVSYILELRDSNGVTLKQLPFADPILADDGPPNRVYKPNPSPKSLKRKNRVLYSLPFVTGATDLILSTIRGNIIQSYPLAESYLEEQPEVDVYSAPATSFTSNSDATLDTRLSSASTLDIGFIGHGYTDLATLQSDVDRFAANLVKYAPFNQYAASIVFYRIDYLGSLSCVYRDRLITCNDSQAHSLAGGAPYDKLVILVNNPSYGGSADSVTVTAYNGGAGTNWGGEHVFVHEFGHSLAALMDEYVSGYLWGKGNCYNGTPPNPVWAGTVSDVDYRQGCSMSNYYAPSQSSVMLTLDSSYFNVVSQNILATTIAKYTVTGDTLAPIVTLNNPIAGAAVSGATVSFSASTADNVGVSKVQFFVGSKLIGEKTSSPYNISWDSRTTANGSYSIAARAFDAAGNSATSASVFVTVNNGATPVDTTAPSVVISSPLNGAILPVRSKITIKASASDNVGVSRVEFYVNGGLSCTVTAAPYNCSWSVPSKRGKAISIVAKAFDSSGNSTNSAAVNCKSG